MFFQELGSYKHHVVVLIVILAPAINLIVPISGFRDSDYNKRSQDYAEHQENPSHNPRLSSPKECARVCRKGEPPKTCYYHFTLEIYTTLGAACQRCTPNATNWGECQCVLADGVERAILTINRGVPGPSIQVCKGDKVVIDLSNQMQGMETSIHWHGIFHHGTQYYDGVPMVTQCPIAQGDTFRYQWYAYPPGTHFYHGHAGTQKIDGIYGALIIREPRPEDPNSHLYQYDLPAHVILMSDWMHELSIGRFPGRFHSDTGQYPDNLLINGKGKFTNQTSGQTTNTTLESFRVTHGKSYRFRLITSFGTTCPAQLTIQGHRLIAIATDGQPFRPVVVDTIISYSGECYDFVIQANQKVGAYWIQLKALSFCASNQIQQLAILRYTSGPCKPSSPPPTYDNHLPEGKVLNPPNSTCHEPEPRSDAVCINQLKNAKEVDKDILRKDPDIKFFLPIGFWVYSLAEIFKPHTYKLFLEIGGKENVALVNNVSFLPPPAPPLSQIDDIPPESFCSGDKKPRNCGDPCFCTHKLDIPLNAICEVILLDVDQISTLNHPFHLHGYAFNVIGMGGSPYTNVSKLTLEHWMDLDKRGLLERRFDAPPGKDTIAIPNNGYVIFRFKADNPGWWLFHCHFAYHLAIGMGLMVHVGQQSDLPPVPEKFPRCGDFLPPISENDHFHRGY